MTKKSDLEPAKIQYMGLAGMSKESSAAVIRFLQCGDLITDARIVTSKSRHCLVLRVNVGDLVAIKSGFASGYRGLGSVTFSHILELLRTHGANIDEYEVQPDYVTRLDSSALTTDDLAALDNASPVRPARWTQYIFREDLERSDGGTLWHNFPLAIPYAIVDPRIIDLAHSFWEGPDDKLLTAYRRLEDIVRKRTDSIEHGARLFSQAFLGKKKSTSQLTWIDVDAGEHAGRGQLFVGAFTAHRNPRAHRELSFDSRAHLREFLLINHLYHLESDAIIRADHETPDGSELA